MYLKLHLLGFFDYLIFIAEKSDVSKTEVDFSPTQKKPAVGGWAGAGMTLPGTSRVPGPLFHTHQCKDSVLTDEDGCGGAGHHTCPPEEGLLSWVNSLSATFLETHANPQFSLTAPWPGLNQVAAPDVKGKWETSFITDSGMSSSEPFFCSKDRRTDTVGWAARIVFLNL